MILPDPEIFDSMPVQLVFLTLMCMTILLGFFCAFKLNCDYPLWIRLIVLSPSLTSMFTVLQVFRQDYVAYESDIARAFASVAIYALVASRFTDTPWLDIRKDKEK